MFRQHGTFELHGTSDVIYFKAFGAWNVEASDACISALTKMIDQCTSGHFAVCVDTSAVEGITPDGAILWTETIMTWKEKGHTTTVRVDSPNSAIYKVFLKAFDDFFVQYSDFTFANSIEEADKWLEEKGFEVKHPQ